MARIELGGSNHTAHRQTKTQICIGLCVHFESICVFSVLVSASVNAPLCGNVHSRRFGTDDAYAMDWSIVRLYPLNSPIHPGTHQRVRSEPVRQHHPFPVSLVFVVFFTQLVRSVYTQRLLASAITHEQYLISLCLTSILLLNSI